MEEKRKFDKTVYFVYACLREIAGTAILWPLFNRISRHKMLNLIAAYALTVGIDGRLYDGTCKERTLPNEFIVDLEEKLFGDE